MTSPSLDQLDLVGGEVGYVVGSCYTSATGFMTVSNAGNVQLACTGLLLKRCGFKTWDFGMAMDYKIKLGAKKVSRATWVDHIKQLRDEQCDMFPAGVINAAQIIKGDAVAAVERKG